MNGFKEFVSGQKKAEGQATFSFAQFDTDYELIHDMVDIKNVSENFTLVPRGSTALLDAMGNTITNVRNKILSMKDEDKPSKSIFVFITDGEENASRTFKRQDIFDMIEDFMGANQDAIQAGEKLGIDPSATLTYDASAKGVEMAFTSLTNNTVCYRSKGSCAYTFSETDRNSQNIPKTNSRHVSRVSTNGISGDLDINS